MIRSPIKQTQFKPTEPKPESGPRKNRCGWCKTKFVADPPWLKHCSTDCGAELGMALAAKQKAKAQRQERSADKAKRDAMKSYPQLIRETQKVFNEYIRLRDAKQPCICCNRETTKVDGLGSHGWDCGHYRSTGSAPHLRFNEDNAHRQLVFCNRDRSGNAVEYRKGLIDRIGLERVEALESDNKARKWSIEDLQAMKAEYSSKVKQLKKEMI